MGKLLVPIITGVENPSRSVLGFLVAKSAIEDGNEVTIFCAGDGVTSLHDITTKEMQGVGLGTLSDHLDELKDKFKVLATDFKLPEPLIDLTLSHLSQTAISSDPAEAIKEAFAAAQQDFLEIIQERGVQAPNELAKLEGRKAITPASAIVESGMDSKGLLY